MAMSLQGSSGQLTLSSQSGLIQPGQWHHFATVIDAEHGELKIYLDGQPVAQGVIPSGDAIHDTSGDWRLGNSLPECPVSTACWMITRSTTLF